MEQTPASKLISPLHQRSGPLSAPPSVLSKVSPAAPPLKSQTRKTTPLINATGPPLKLDLDRATGVCVC